ncbi:PDR/VanB family oxidoreductase [Mesorhizobium sp. WSM4976]|uniref:PDR/VanB family oxidoreductase n=1 Tax=Mesorhizobium sp. WSM4976 TaxID=3038549 RepID=UPI002416E2A7|nr:PDR/VanB family oxidoreductase [Mesorhizobium sp. WSM4976]MDG4897645.1 PDR/VanB family oxidoreductase [Mesorhizobium sp. WSM4976]
MSPAEPGSHIDLHLPNGLIRQYSLYREADGSKYEFAVKRTQDSRGGSQFIHEKLAKGDILTISQPRNNFVLGRHPHTLLIAGGIGITPIIAMSRKLAAEGRSFALHYFCRDAEPPFRNCVDELTSRCATRYVGLDPAATARKLSELVAGDIPGQTHVYVCGPEPLMDETVRLAAPKLGKHAIHLERFSPGSIAADRACQAFTVKLSRSGKTLEVPPDRSLLSVLVAAGVRISSSCQEGICGSCLTGVLCGTPDHRDSFLTDEEKEAGQDICPCVSRAKTPELVLDL